MRFHTVFILALTAMAATALGQPADSSGERPTPVEIIYATPMTQPQMFAAGEKKVVDRFMAEYPHIRVKVRQIPFESYDTQVLLSVKGGHPPDVGRVNHSTLRMWAGAGYLRPLDDFVKRTPIIVADDYWPGFWNICTMGDRLFALPLGTDCRILAYNVKLFKQAGLEPPETWAELLHAAQTINRPSDKVYGIAFPASNEWSASYDAVGNFLIANDGQVINDTGTQAVIADDPRAREAFRFICELAVKHKVTPPGIANMSGDVIDALFVDDRLGMMVTGPWVMGNMERMRPEFKWPTHYGMVVIPAAPGTGHSGSSQGGWLIGAFTGSKHPDEALQLLEFMSRPESLATMSAVENLPPRKAAVGLDPFRDPFYKVFFEQLPYARPPLPVVPQLPNIARAIQRAYQQVVAGGSDVDEAIEWLDDKISNHLLD